MNAYEILNCDINATKLEIKQSYHQLLLKYHPDKCYEETEKESNLNKFLQIKAAFHILNDDISKATYDSHLKQIQLDRNSAISDSQSMFLINQDFNFDIQHNGYYRTCRCGGLYFIQTSELNNLMLENEKNTNNDIDVFFSIQCDSCSLCINVLIV